ncbi:MAG TPA: XdhC family protein, partial [Polyangiaceae bacterium]
LNTPERFPACRLELRDPVERMRELALSERDWVLVMTHDHQLDQNVLELALQKEPRYIGLVGSRRKVLTLRERIAARSGAPFPNDRVYGPVGLDLGAVGPEELAVSIVAELIALRHGKKAAHLRAT